MGMERRWAERQVRGDKMNGGLMKTWSISAAGMLLFVAPLLGRASEPQAATEVKLFDAIQQGQITVDVTPTSYFLVTMTVRNRTAQPLKVKTPEVFAAVATKRLRAWQAAARRNGPRPEDYANQYGYARQYDPGGSQSLGGSFYYQNSSPGEDASARSEPKLLELELKPRGRLRFQVPTFCMEFGLPDPNPRIAYTLVPLEVVTRSPAIKHVLIEFGKGKHHQAVAQLAMWHVANGTPWERLASVQWPGRIGRVTLPQLRAARELAEKSRAAASSESPSSQNN